MSTTAIHPDIHTAIDTEFNRGHTKHHGLTPRSHKQVAAMAAAWAERLGIRGDL